MSTLSDRKYRTTHEWVKIEGQVAIVGISDYAQESLGDITYLELPQAGKVVKKGDEIASIESVKAASDIYTPLSGKISEVNGNLDSAPEIINSNPYDQGWIFKLTSFDATDMEDLMDAQAYDAFVATIQ